MAVALPTGRRGQMLALLIAFAAVLIAWAEGVEPLVRLYGDRSIRLEQRQQLAERMEALAAQLPALEARVKAMDEEGPGSVATVSGGTDAIAQANLQKIVRDMASQAGATISSVETREGEAEPNGYRRIAIRINLNAPWSALVALLSAIDRSRVPMLVDDLQIRAPTVIAANATPVLASAFTVHAFRDAAPTDAKSPDAKHD